MGRGVWGGELPDINMFVPASDLILESACSLFFQQRGTGGAF